MEQTKTKDLHIPTTERSPPLCRNPKRLNIISSVVTSAN